jgi:hypothetical protein
MTKLNVTGENLSISVWIGTYQIKIHFNVIGAYDLQNGRKEEKFKTKTMDTLVQQLNTTK